MERSLGEVRRRTNVIGRFPGEQSCLVPVRLTCLAADNLSPQNALRYFLDQRAYSGTSWGRWTPLLMATSACAVTRSLAPRSRYQFRTRARAAAGIWARSLTDGRSAR